jgi:hypothetical protein
MTWGDVIFLPSTYLVQLWGQTISYAMDTEESSSGDEDGKNMKLVIQLTKLYGHAWITYIH